MAKTQLIKKIFSIVNGFGGVTTSSKFERIIQSTFTSEESMEVAALLVRKKEIDVNSNLKRQGMRSDWGVVIKEISINTLKDIIITIVSEFGEIKLIKIQLIGMWQKAVMEFAKLGQTNSLAFRWSFLIGKNSVQVAKAVGDCEIWVSRNQFRALLFTLPIGTIAHDLETLLNRAGGKTCVINRFLKTGNKIHCTVVGFESDNDLKSAFCTELIFGGIKLSWARMDLVRCEKCEKFGHSALKCDASIASPSKPLRTFKRVASDGCHFQLAKLYEKKSVPISCPTAFGGKSWAQVVSLAGFSGGFYFSFGSGSGTPFFGVLDSDSGFPLTSANDSSLNICLATLEHFLELLTDQVFGILKKLGDIELVPKATSSGVFFPATPTSLVPLLDVNMIFPRF
ncbi:hypothetical protein G9A89_012735 [Geosiphon pyriformis]|nr:hypothetical protein G9A89_012735 [Geosiphon pyriformis]